MKIVIGIFFFCGVFLGLVGMFSFIVSGWNVLDLFEFLFGYVYLFVLVGIILILFFILKFGVIVVNSLFVLIFKKGFVCLLFVMVVKIFLS